jgi:HPt (histidine-containing phosphotransfer) domain-containing protein
MKGDRERCLQAGFDAYVTKPVQLDELYDAIDRLAGPAPKDEPAERLSIPSMLPAPPASDPSAAIPKPDAESLFDRKRGMERAGGDAELLRELVEVFQTECPKWLADIDAAAAASDARRLQRAAHTLKGAVDNFGARPVYNAALRLEQMARADDLAGAAEAVATLREICERLQTELAAWLRDETSGRSGAAGSEREEMPW